jgi:meiosis-specific APC/C activator protein AMA1
LVSSLDVDAQITTLIWSPTTTEILATFGYTAPGIKTKCAVYAYPSLQCLFSFEIADEIRALYAVVSPSGGDICLAGSDECVRFYRIWEITRDGDTNKSRESSPVRDIVDGVDGQLQQQNTRRRRVLRSGLSVIR